MKAPPPLLARRAFASGWTAESKVPCRNAVWVYFLNLAAPGGRLGGHFRLTPEGGAHHALLPAPFLCLLAQKFLRPSRTWQGNSALLLSRVFHHLKERGRALVQIRFLFPLHFLSMEEITRDIERCQNGDFLRINGLGLRGHFAHLILDVPGHLPHVLLVRARADDIGFSVDLHGDGVSIRHQRHLRCLTRLTYPGNARQHGLYAASQLAPFARQQVLHSLKFPEVFVPALRGSVGFELIQPRLQLLPFREQRPKLVLQLFKIFQT
uniref:Uncharacterized protein n=1 Tax=uncultured marine microorganism HF4000_ANIW137I15 TaxID=455531 RepID=B3T4L2_9ZZZZ|nr:hypothetical protein ALOHA_HF4000ANIW137I15ctg3g11 [uncultured marine microorganism HF4000_ANIW137I15]